jgi:hypothetical protein
VVGSWALNVRPDFELPPGISLVSFEALPSCVIREGTPIAKFRLSGYARDTTVGIAPNLATNLGCDEPPPPCHPNDTFDRRLAEMVNAVGSIVTAFEEQF